MEKIKYSRPSDLSGVEIMLVEHSARRWRAFHETYTIATILDVSGGISEWVYRSKIHRTEAGNIMLMEPGEVHANRKITPPGTFRVLFVDTSVIDRAAKESDMPYSQPHFKLANVTDPGLFRAFEGLHRSLESETSTLERQFRFAACIRLLLKQSAERPSTPVPKHPNRLCLSRAREFIREYYAENITLDDLATVTGLSRFHLVRAFAAEFGMPPHAYQNQVRLTEARKLIAAGVPLAVIAAEVGFADQSHFARHFRRTYGVTPGEYGGRVRDRQTPYGDSISGPAIGTKIPLQMSPGRPAKEIFFS